MSTSGQMEPMPPPEVPYVSFVATIWAFVAASGITLICRLVSRLRGPRRLFWDDGLVILSWIVSLATAATWQWAAKDMYYIMNVQAALATYNPDTFLTSVRNWLTASLIAELSFYTALFAIKLSFLFFFHRLGKGVYKFKYIWWPVLVVTSGSYISSVGIVDYKCFVGSVEQITGVCRQRHELKFSEATLRATAGLDVITDFMIMILPAFLMWNTQIRWSKKLALIGLFSLSIITIVIALVRAIMVGLSRRPDGNPDVTWLWFWSAVEPSVAIMVCCGSAFPQLFTSSTRSSKQAVFSPPENYHRMMSRIHSSRKKQQTEDDPMWLNLTAISLNSTDEFGNHSPKTAANCSHGREADLESGNESMFAQRDRPRENSLLVPNGHGPIPAVCTYIGASKKNTFAGPENQISQRFKFETKQTRASWGPDGSSGRV